MSLPRVQLFILTYNRPEFVIESVSSALAQDYQNLEVVISDNSTTNLVSDVLRKNFPSPSYTYIRRTPSLPALTHFNTILSEVSADYFILFHDDDILLPHAVSTLIAHLSSNGPLAAIAGNAFVIDREGKKKSLFMTRMKKDQLIRSPEQMAEHYLIFNLNHPPFPSYLYSRTAAQSLTMEYKEGQKHADVSFLIKLAHRGPILWLAEPIMHYRKHGGNDSLSIDLKAALSLCRFIARETQTSRSILETFKLLNFIKWAKQRRSGISKSLGPKTDLIIQKSIRSLVCKHPFGLFSHFLGTANRKLTGLVISRLQNVDNQ